MYLKDLDSTVVWSHSEMPYLVPELSRKERELVEGRSHRDERNPVETRSTSTSYGENEESDFVSR